MMLQCDLLPQQAIAAFFYHGDQAKHIVWCWSKLDGTAYKVFLLSNATTLTSDLEKQ
jgi:hypothetical protein